MTPVPFEKVGESVALVPDVIVAGDPAKLVIVGAATTVMLTAAVVEPPELVAVAV
jgi:hypothetical protein